MAKAGDVWLLGEAPCRMRGDSILSETYDVLMDGRKANLVPTDPPYNVNVEETAGKIKNDNMADADFTSSFCGFCQHGAVDGAGCFHLCFPCRYGGA